MRKKIVIIRLFATTGLLIEVWLHAHWSIALCLTLLAITTEISK